MSDNISLSARENTVRDILESSSQLQVPDYQREYAWDERQWDDFWNDLTSLLNGRDTHFFGSTVVIEHADTDPAILELVDGQQRFTTISILLCVIRDQYKTDRDWEDRAGHVQDNLIVKDSDYNEHPKLQLTLYNNDEYQAVLEGYASELDDCQLKAAYDYFTEQVEDRELEWVDDLRKELLNSMSLVTIECDSEVSAFRLFESLNNKGLDLSSVDLMKNHLFKIATEDPEINEGEIKALWEEGIRNLREVLQKPERFFRHYLMATELLNVSNSISSTRLYDVFQRVVDQDIYEAGLTLEDFVEDMREKSELYIDIVNCEVDFEWMDRRERQRVNAKLDDIKAIRNTQIRTLLLRLFEEFNEFSDVMQALRLIEVYLIRIGVANYGTGSYRDRVFATICTELSNESNPHRFIERRFREHSPSDAQFKAELKDYDFKQNDRTKYMLDQFEQEHFAHSGVGKQVADRDLVDIEHIAPRNSFSAKKYSTWQQYLDVSEDEFEQHYNRLGNLTLLESSMNATASDHPFEQKKREYETSDFEMTRKLCSYEDWSVDLIEERSEKLAEVAAEIWNFNNV
ncbi:DUF262 domain-containing protein [Halorussus sp. MSC15.2]|uniref:DUF262 domain-containing protein n=1 Tax=Halorussus sp. MSC15.2 TaxID=2283638 RepID=UPI0013D590BA|nr:DUF262 domain-containing protein [Halorussus sp. MSC15.2]NEU56272.1 DUF262 domain-containing protein [Halorussus sp. MSC15.2]